MRAPAGTKAQLPPAATDQLLRPKAMVMKPLVGGGGGVSFCRVKVDVVDALLGLSEVTTKAAAR